MMGISSYSSSSMFVFRVDASQTIGSGHVMRCLTLADVLRDAGHRCVFVCKTLEGNFIEIVRSREYEVLSLEASHQMGRQTTYSSVGAEMCWDKDAEETIDVLKCCGLRPDWVVVDHYFLDFRWEEKIGKHCGALMVIDDLANRTHNCTLLLDQNYYSDPNTRYQHLVPEDTQVFVGPQYSLLAPSYRSARRFAVVREQIKRVLVYYGAADLGNATGKAVEALCNLETLEFRVDIVLGGKNPHSDSLMKVATQMETVSVHRQLPDLAQLILSADLALGAGGATTWERILLGLPTITSVVASNQWETSHALAKDDYVILADDTADSLEAALHKSLSDTTMHSNMSERCLSLAVGTEWNRIIQLLTAH